MAASLGRRKHVFLLLSIGIVVFSVLFFLHGQYYRDKPAVPGQSTHAGQQSADPGLPKRLRIPSIHVDAAIQYVGVAPDGTMDIPSNSVDVGWFKLGSRPGNLGSAVIAGHLDGKNSEVGVFDKLHLLKPGDIIEIVDEKGATVSFMVRKSKIFNLGEDVTDVFGQSDGNHLNLITCDGVWDHAQKSYTKRLVVYTDIIL